MALLLTVATGAWAQDPDPIDLTPSADGTVWTLSTMPEYDVELEVTYYTDAELDQMAADEVIAKITAIGTVTYTPESKALIDAARTAYDALTAAQQALVTNYSTLTDAETTYATAEETAYTVTLKEGTEDATSWTIAPAEATTTGVAAGTTVTATYSGTKKVKSVKAKKKAAALSITSPSVGQVIGSDGKNYAAASVPSGVTKVAMIAYVSGSNGLAIALADEGSLNWATAKSTCEAKTPAFTGGTWHLPTQAEWNQMFSANGGSEGSYTGLNTAITTAGGTVLQVLNGYWSSTPDGIQAYYVYLDANKTDWRKKPANFASPVRACLAF